MDILDRIYRERIGDEISDLLLEHGIHLDYSLCDGVRGGIHIAYGRMGGWKAHEQSPAARCLIGTGKTQRASAAALVTGDAKLHHAPNMKTSLWALGEAMELAAGAMAGNRQHDFYECDGKKAKCIEARCIYCEGGLTYCLKCKKVEGELEDDYCRGS